MKLFKPNTNHLQNRSKPSILEALLSKKLRLQNCVVFTMQTIDMFSEFSTVAAITFAYHKSMQIV